MIRFFHPGSGSCFFTHPGSRIQGSKGHRIPNPDPQHWLLLPSRSTADTGCLSLGSWFFFHPGSNNNKKEIGKKLLSYIFCGHNFHKNILFEQLQKKFEPIDKECNYVSLTKKIVTKLSEIWAGYPESGKFNPGSGSVNEFFNEIPRFEILLVFGPLWPEMGFRIRVSGFRRNVDRIRSPHCMQLYHFQATLTLKWEPRMTVS